MENFNEEQMHDQMRRRQEMFKKMGAPHAGQVLNETAITGTVNTGMAAKLAAIKSGAAKSDFSKFMSAKGNSNGGSSAPGQASFQGIPEPKAKRGPKEEVSAEHRQNIEEFSAPMSTGNSELDAINSLFGDTGGGRASSNQSMGNSNDFHMTMDLDSVMPSFNPEAVLQQKVRQSNQSQNQTQQENPYLKYAGNVPQQQQQQPTTDMSQMNIGALQMMMETIAKGIAEKTIRSVLNEYTNEQKAKPQLEYYNKEKGIVRTPDGKLYKLQPVVITKKV